MSDHIISTRRRRVSSGAATIRPAVQGGGEPPPETVSEECPHRAGLRVLARMIVEHAVAHPETFDALPPDDPVPPPFSGFRVRHADARASDAP